MWYIQITKTRFIKIELNMEVLGVGIGFKKHGGYYLYDNWAGYFKACCHIIFLDIQVKLWKSKERKDNEREIAAEADK